MSFRRTPACVIALLLTLAPVRSWAGSQQADLALRLSPLGRARPRAPVLVQVELTSGRPGLLSGRLELRALEGLEELWRYTTDEIALAAGPQRQTLLLPPVMPTQGAEPVEIGAVFRTDQAEISLGRHPLLLASDDQRSLHLGISDPYAGSTRRHDGLLAALDLERLDPDPKRSRLRVLRSHLEPAFLPESAVALVGFDVLALLDEGLAELEEKQLAALRIWARAGGALLIRPGVALERRHLDFLRGLLEEYAEQSLELDAAGRLQAPEPTWEDGLGCFRCGLGRVVVVLAESGAAPDPAAVSWRWATAFLWRIRASQWSSVRKRGVWDIKRDRTPQQLRREIHTVSPEQTQRHYVDARPLPLQDSQSLYQLLLPERIEMVSIWTLSAILVVYILLIGPGDYILLGRLRRRWLTWISFPLWSVLATLVTMGIVRAQLGANDHLGRIIVRDVDAQGRPLRELRLELHFLAYPKTERRELREVWLTPMGPYSGDTNTYSRSAWREQLAGSSYRAEWQGRLPRRYTVVQEIGQWSPQLNRVLELEPQGSGLGLDWTAAAAEAPPRGREGLYRGVFEGHGKRTDMEGRLDDFLCGFDAQRGRDAAARFARLCFHDPEGLFAVLSQISPCAAPDFEGFAVLDSDDQRQRLVVAGARQGDDIVFERRLFVKGAR